jgi:hypothetical protein
MSTDCPVLVTYSNMGYFGFAKNLILNLSSVIKHHKVHFYCLDEEILKALQDLNVTNIDITYELYDVDVSRRFESYGSAAYNKITHTKMSVLKDALEKYGYIHFIDCDVVCLKEPTPEYWSRYHEYDVVFQYDAGFDSADKPHWPYFHIWACTGNTSFRNTPGTHRVIDKILEYQARYPTKNDQECLFEYFKENNIRSLLDADIGRLYEFPVREFTNGYWVGHDIGDTSQTYFFHANHAVGPAAKLQLLHKVGSLYR